MLCAFYLYLNYFWRLLEGLLLEAKILETSDEQTNLISVSKVIPPASMQFTVTGKK